MVAHLENSAGTAAFALAFAFLWTALCTNIVSYSAGWPGCPTLQLHAKLRRRWESPRRASMGASPVAYWSVRRHSSWRTRTAFPESTERSTRCSLCTTIGSIFGELHGGPADSYQKGEKIPPRQGLPLPGVPDVPRNPENGTRRRSRPLRCLLLLDA